MRLRLVCAKSFYLDQLGFSLIAESTFGDDLRWIQVGIPGTQTSLTLVTSVLVSPERPGELADVGLGVEELDVDLSELDDCGVPIDSEQAVTSRSPERPTKITRAVRTRTSSM